MISLGRAMLAASLACAVSAAPREIGAAAAAPSAHITGRYYNVTATVLQYNLETGEFATQSKITITRPGLEVVADSASGNVKAGNTTLRGHVVVHDSGGPGSPQGKNAAPATLTCDQLEVDGKADTYRATGGRPHYESGARKATADTMLLDRKQKKLHLEGDVMIAEGEQTAKASTIDVDLKTGAVELHGSPVELTAPVSPGPKPPGAPGPKPPGAPPPRANPHPVPTPSRGRTGPSPVPSPRPAPNPSPAASASPAPSASPTGSSSPAPSASVIPSPAPSAAASAKPGPAASPKPSASPG
jgi:lipopolysaccharide export system protein LptA